MKDKFILDACCGGKMFWFNKEHPNAIYIDNRIEEKGFLRNGRQIEVKPDILMDFRKLDFPDKSFKLVVLDPPFLKNVSENFIKNFNMGNRGEDHHQFIIGYQYGYLDKNTWKEDLKKGFDECWRVLDDYGVLIFKWGDHDIKIKELLEVLGREPLFGHRTRNSKRGNTHWFCFMKIPNEITK
ncbi:MAG: class I SAM-dependent methyltransferase [Candidatus Omnitrophica bacterium]|nr:class I SAM-dependent methyltransferase [Candidatus Omnitrophota bacterium]